MSAVDADRAPTIASDTAETPVEMLVGTSTRWVHVEEGLTPLGARERNRERVAQTLEEAQIPYFAVRGLDDRTSVLGVSEADRQRVYKAVGRLFERERGYVGQIQPRPATPGSLQRGNSRATWTSLAGAQVVRLVWFRTESSRSLVYGEAYGCEIEFWQAQPEKERLLCPRHTRSMRVVEFEDDPVEVPGERFTRLAADGSGQLPPVRSRAEFARVLPEEVRFPIDVVYTWVDGQDPEWRRRKAAAAGESYHEESASDARFLSRDELRYSLRSLHMNAPWVRKVFVVTDDQTPAWLETAHPGVQVVSHKEIFSDPSVLPVFNSHAIESQLHHIDGLAEHFLYFNDDMFVGRPLAPQAFFLANGVSRFFHSQSRVPMKPKSEADTPVDAACKNNRALIEEAFGVTLTQTFQHVPYAMRRSVLAEIEERFPQAYRTTMASRFRSMSDHSIPSSLYHYYAFLTGHAVPGSVRYGYVQLAVPDLAVRLERALARRDWDAFCLNDAYSTELELERQNQVLRPFLESYFPIPSPLEKPATAERP
jgi:hypothetical protein